VRSSTLDSLATLIMASCAIVVTIVVVSRRGASDGLPSRNTADVQLTPESWATLLSEGVQAGPSEAPAQLVVFADFQCPACRGFNGTVLPKLRARFKDDLSVRYRHWPLGYHSEAVPAALASECAKQQGRFWEFHDTLYSQQSALGVKSYAQLAHEAGVPDTSLLNHCMQDPATIDPIERDRQLAETLGSEGTPTILLNGVLLRSGSLEGVLSDRIAELVGAGT